MVVGEGENPLGGREGESPLGGRVGGLGGGESPWGMGGGIRRGRDPRGSGEDPRGWVGPLG